jgi:hypothetical protein
MLDEHELRQLLAEMGVQGSNSEAKRLLWSYDQDYSGVVEKAEFERFLRHLISALSAVTNESRFLARSGSSEPFCVPTSGTLEIEVRKVQTLPERTRGLRFEEIQSLIAASKLTLDSGKMIELTLGTAS